MRLSKIPAFSFHLHFRQRPNLFKLGICLVFNIINWPPAAISVHLNQSLSYKQRPATLYISIKAVATTKMTEKNVSKGSTKSNGKRCATGRGVFFWRKQKGLQFSDNQPRSP